MDYITKKIKEKSELCVFARNYKDAAVQEQSRLEYILNLILAYLWNKQIERVDEETRASAYLDISHPSIGTIISLARKLDIDSEIFGEKKLRKFIAAVNKYPSIRNEKIGHGFSFEDDSEELFKVFSDLYLNLYENGPAFIRDESDIVQVLDADENSSKGILYKANGDCSPCAIAKSIIELQEGNVYLRNGNDYFKLTPFIAIQDIEDFYVYSFIEDRLACRGYF